MTPLISLLTLLRDTHADSSDVRFIEPLKRLESHKRAKMKEPLECTSHSPSGEVKVAFVISFTSNAFYVDESPLTSPEDPEPPDTS